MKKMTTRQMAADSMLAAMCAVLGAVALDVGNLKITLESVPIIVGALLFGSLDGAAIGFVGTLVYQFLRYGVSVTTLLWVLPYVVCGLIVGLYAQKRGFSLSTKQTIIIVVIAELVVTTLNTGVMYIDSKIYGYYSAVYIFGSIAVRYAICVGKAIVIGGGAGCRRQQYAAGAAAARKGLQGRVIWFIQCLLILRGECSDDCT